MELGTINDYIAKIKSGDPSELQTHCESLKKIISGLPKELRASISEGELITVLLDTLRLHSTQVEIITPVTAILFTIGGWAENAHINREFTLYINCFRLHIENELFCRTVLGLLFQISTSMEIKHGLMQNGITELMIQSALLYNRNERVYTGLKRLTNKLTEFKPHLVGFASLLIEKIAEISSEKPPSENDSKILQLCLEMFIVIATGNSAASQIIAQNYETLVLVSRNVDEPTYINIDKILVENGRTITGAPIEAPYSVMTPKGFSSVTPFGIGAVPKVYTVMGHGSEMISEIPPIPVPAGCVYVTFAICGNTTQGAYRILDAFANDDIRELLRYPVENIKKLTEYFGESLHVHYPEAENETSRTYFDVRYSPFAHFNTPKLGCFAYKSGLYNMDANVEFMPDENLMVRLTEILKYGIKFDCDSIEPEILKLLYNGSLYPTLDTIVGDIDPARAITYKLLKHEITKFKFSQSWAFRMFPGVHYNFVCRSHSLPNENNTGRSAAVANRITRRRRNSLNAATLLLSKSGGKKRSMRFRRTRRKSIR